MPERSNTKKLGRPTFPPGKKKLSPLGFRPTPELREQLDNASKSNGRSVAQEIQSRLEKSFIVDTRGTEFREWFGTELKDGIRTEFREWFATEIREWFATEFNEKLATTSRPSSTQNAKKYLKQQK